jgi:hypothetical protein
MSTPGQRILAALQTRLERITVANNFPLTVKTVLVNKGEIEFGISADRLPLIDIIQADEQYEHESSGFLNVNTSVILRMVLAQGASDSDMEEFKSAIIRCVYANSYVSNSGNTGIHLADGGGGTIYMPRLISCQNDIAMVEGNRIYALLFELHSKRTVWQF